MKTIITSVMSIILLVKGSMYPSESAGCGQAKNYEAITRYYCIAAVDVDWDYALNSDNVTGDLTGLYNDKALKLLSRSRNNIGKVYRKILLMRYPYNDISHSCSWDDNFYADANSRSGLLGPILRAVVGDTLVVHFLNKAATVYAKGNGNMGPEFNLVPQGLWSEVDINRGKAGYGDEVVYLWEALASSG